jgi:hypothetical protein
VGENFLDQYDRQTQQKLLDFSSEIADGVWAMTISLDVQVFLFAKIDRRGALMTDMCSLHIDKGFAISTQVVDGKKLMILNLLLNNDGKWLSLISALYVERVAIIMANIYEFGENSYD